MAVTTINPNFRQANSNAIATAPSERVAHPLTRWCFYAFLFTLPFEVMQPDWLPMFLRGNLSIPRMAGIALLLAFLLDFGLRPWKFTGAFLCFSAYFVVCVFRLGIFNPSWAFSQFQLLAIFFICYNLFTAAKTTRGALLSFIASCTLSAGLMALGALASERMVKTTGGRVAMFGMDPNIYAKYMVVGVICALAIAHARKEKSPALLLLLWPAALLLVTRIANTGSRSMSLALVVGLTALVLRKGGFSARIPYRRVAEPPGAGHSGASSLFSGTPG